MTRSSSASAASTIRQGRAFWHYGKDLDTVRRENATFLERSVFLGAFSGETLIGFAKLVSDDERRQAALMQIVSMIAYRDKAPTNALIAQAVRSCAGRRIGYLVYSQFAYGRKEHDGLSDFKQHNGFQRIDLPRYYVPLTAVGRIALCLRLHHNVIDHVPEPVLAQLRTQLFARGEPSREVMHDALQLLARTDLRPETGAISQPAVVVAGERDTLVPPAAGEWLSRTLPRASFCLIPGAAHAPFLSHPDAFMSAFADAR